MPHPPPRPSYRVSGSSPAELLDRLRVVAFLKQVNRERLQLAGRLTHERGTPDRPWESISLRWPDGVITVGVDATRRVWIQGNERVELEPDVIAVKAAIYDALVSPGQPGPKPK